ncbi:hypothetical protein BDQ17DRAFT_1359562 [Cyathus striatus]|nr:hypothetical protein BDQ17DRAFT_1359562 [Cyathus striatus]
MLSSRPIHIPTDGAHFPLKTPGRTKNNRAENAVGSMTVGRAGGKAMGLKTPFAGGSIKPTAQTVLRPKPLGDKTPFPNRVSNIQNFQTPGAGGKIKQLSFLPTKDGVDEVSPRASATRKHARPPRKSFETPMNNGHHWDVSDLDIDVEAIQEEAEVKDEFEDWGEVEYGPPNTLHLLYDLPNDFDLPDYKEVGNKLKQMRYIPWMDDYEPPEIEVKPEDVQVPAWEDIGFQFGELEDDDIFAQLRPKPAPVQPAASKTAVKGRSATTLPGARKPVATRPPGSTLATSKLPVTKAAPATSRATATSGAAPPSSGIPRSRITRPTAVRPGTSTAVSRPAPAPAAPRPRVATTAARTGVASSTRPSTRTGAAGSTRPGTTASSLSRGTSVSNSRATSSSRVAGKAAAKPAIANNDVDVPVLPLDVPTEVEDFAFDI